MESDCPQLSLGNERPATTAGNGAIGVSQPGKFTDRKPDGTTLANATFHTDNRHATVGPEQASVTGAAYPDFDLSRVSGEVVHTPSPTVRLGHFFNDRVKFVRT